MRNSVEELAERGFVLLDRVVDDATLSRLRSEVDRLSAASADRGGVRNVLARSEVLRRYAARELAGLAERFVGRPARAVKLTLFDKTPAANWKVPLHQDLTITVRERREVEGFGPWSTKDGLPHVQPPAWVLESIVAIRLHLDETPASGGALRVIPGSHRQGRLSAAQIRGLSENAATELCAVAAGGAMVMSPLLVHASSPADRPSHRRVLHYEFTDIDLPGGLEWAFGAS